MNLIEKENAKISALDWKEKGKYIRVFNKNVFTIDTKNNPNCLVILHGYATSSFDYYKVLPELSKHYRVILQDFVGFGFSDKLENNYFTITDQADYTVELWQTLGLKNITILAHDYGTEIAHEILAREKSAELPVTINEVIFSNCNMPLDYLNYSDKEKELQKGVSKKLVYMLASYSFYKKTIQDFFYDKSKIFEDDIKAMWYQHSYNNGRDTLNFVCNYISERLIFINRWLKALKETKIPIRLVCGKEDPLTIEHTTQLFSTITNNIRLIDNSGHYPMLETPDTWIKSIID